MKSTHVLLVAMVLLAAVAIFWGRSDAQAPPRPVAPVARVAVCDVGVLFNGYKRRQALETLFENKRKQAKAADDAKAAQIDKLKKVLESLNANTNLYEQKLREMQKLALERQVWQQLQEQQFVREHRMLMQDLYAEILAAVADTARKTGYDLVIYRDSVEVKSKTTAELLNKIAQRKCLYNNPAIDLTRPVLDLLNKRFQAGKAKRPGG